MSSLVTSLEMAVDLAIPDLAAELAGSVRKLLVAEGGTELCRAAEADPGRREILAALLGRLGLWELDAREDVEQAMAAAEVVRVAGSMAVPYPVVGRLLSTGSSWLAVVGDCSSPVRVEHGDLGSWLLAGLDGSSSAATGLIRGGGQKLAPFVCRGPAGQPADAVPAGDVARWLALDSFWLLGAAETALERTVDHLLSRHQFGRPLAGFQAVRLGVAERVTLLEGLRTLGQYTIWHQFERPEDALVDAIALRAVALEAVTATFWAAHQYHGAVGLSLEHDVTLLHRHAQGHLRLPLDYDAVCVRLVAEIDRGGFESLYGRFQGGSSAKAGQ